MKLEKRITLTAYEVEYVDTREPKPRTVYWELVVLDGGRLSALARLGQSPAAFIAQHYEAAGFRVASIHRGGTVEAHMDLYALWEETQQKIVAERELRAQAEAAKERSAAE